MIGLRMVEGRTGPAGSGAVGDLPGGGLARHGS